MQFNLCLAAAIALFLSSVSAFGQVEEQRILRRVIKSTPTANQLTRVRLISVRATPTSGQEKGAVAEISSKEAATFGQRSANETSSSFAKTIISQSAPTKSKQPATQAPTSTTSTTTTTAPTTTSSPSVSTSSEQPKESRLSERLQNSQEVELLSGAPSSWQSMTAVEAPVALLERSSKNLLSSDTSIHSTEELAPESASSDFLRAASATKGGSSSYTRESVGETFSRLRQQQDRQLQQQQRQSFFYPQQQQVRPISKTSNYQQATKTHWYQPAPKIATPRPAPLIQQQEQYEQQNEQYVEQQQQVEYGPAPLGQAEPFAFDFKTLDNNGNGQYRKEESDKNGVVHGSYGYTDANGIYRHVEYVADQDGFRANIKSNEPGLIGETQPASIQLARGSGSPAQVSQRFSASTENGLDWTSEVSHNQGSSSSSAELALAPPNFESSHKPERIRSVSPRHY